MMDERRMTRAFCWTNLIYKREKSEFGHSESSAAVSALCYALNVEASLYVADVRTN